MSRISSTKKEAGHTRSSKKLGEKCLSRGRKQARGDSRTFVRGRKPRGGSGADSYPAKTRRYGKNGGRLRVYWYRGLNGVKGACKASLSRQGGNTRCIDHKSPKR